MVKTDELNAKKILILGLARQGLAMARFAAEVGADVTVSDIRSADELESSLNSLSDFLITKVLGHHPIGLLEDLDLIVVSGGVSLDLPLVIEARKRGIKITNDSLEFFKRSPCDVIGITGSAGKTTTTALTGAMVESSGRRSWIGGNIGRPLLQELREMNQDDLVVQELSSFQLDLWTRSPTIASILNITPNHLDRHKTMKAYINAKAHIFDYQSADDTAVLPLDDPAALALKDRINGRLRTFSLINPVADGAYLDDGILYIRDGSSQDEICAIEDIPIRGRHNVLNILAAAVLAHSAGVPVQAMHEAISNFKGVPHRLEEVASIDGVLFINDSIATAPERAIAALNSFAEPIILLAGGRDKDLVWDDWTEAVLKRTRVVILFGELAEPLEKQLKAAADNGLSSGTKIIRVDALDEAVDASRSTARSGDIVLLSPGGTSFDSFSDFEARGEAFRRIVLDSTQNPQTSMNIMLN